MILKLPGLCPGRAVKEHPMKTKLVTGPEKKPISVDAVKEHLRIHVADLSHDHMIEQFIQSAVEQVEEETGRALITQAWDLIFSSWDELIWKDKFCDIRRILPFGRCQSVGSITYLDTDKSSRTLNTDQYEVSGVGTDEARIMLLSAGGFDYPSLYEVDPITLRLVCGYGDNEASIPMQIQTAIKIIVSDLFDDEDHRETIQSALKSHKLWSF